MSGFSQRDEFTIKTLNIKPFMTCNDFAMFFQSNQSFNVFQWINGRSADASTNLGKSDFSRFSV